MAIISRNNGKTLVTDAISKRVETLRERLRADHEEEFELSPEEEDRFKILRYCAKTYEEAQKGRKAHETFDRAWDIYTSRMWLKGRPPWRASITLNFIRQFITFMQSVMTDNKPRVSVEPMIPGSEDAADLLRKLVDRDWDDNNMQLECSRWVLYGLVFGYAFMKVYYDPFANGGRGKHCVDVIPPYKIYTNPEAKGIEDAEYIIHTEDMTMGWIRRNFPERAKACSKLRGVKRPGDKDYYPDRDLIREGDNNAPRILSAMQIQQNIVMPQLPMSRAQYWEDQHDTVEVAEYHLRDDSLESYQRQVIENGVGKMAPVIENGEPVMEIVGTKTILNEITGMPDQVPDRKPKMAPVMETAWRLKYPNGRLVVIAGGKVVLRDIPYPYQTDGFCFAMWKDYDVGSIFGQGEPLTLESCGIAVNKIASQVFEILQKMGNPGWKIKKGAGVNINGVTNKPGLCIPMDDTKDGLVPMDKPAIPGEFFSLYELIVKGMAQISGVNDAVTGSIKADNTGYATIDQLQESGSAPLRLKVRNFESGLTRFGKLRIQLIQQYDKGDRPIRMEQEYPEGVVPPTGNVLQEFRSYNPQDIQGQVDFRVIPISSLSVSPSGKWNRYLTLKDKGLIDDIWWHETFRIEGWKSQLPRLLKQKAQDAAMEAAAKKASKVGGNKSISRSAAQSRRGPPTQLPSRGDLAATR